MEPLKIISKNIEDIPLDIVERYLNGTFSIFDKKEQKLLNYSNFIGLSPEYIYIFEQKILNNLSWTDGVKHFKSIGYKNKLTLPHTIPPVWWERDSRIEYKNNGILFNIFANAKSSDFPPDWEKNQIDKKYWIEETFDIFIEK